MTLTYTLELVGPGEETVEYAPDGDDLFIELIDTLDAETSYSWTVMAENSAGYTKPSDTWLFKTGTGFNNPPLPPENIYPYGRDIPLDPTFTWTCLDPEGDPLTYYLSLGLYPDGEYELIIEGQIDTEYHLQDPLLEYSTDYKWQVVAHDAESRSAPSFRYIFTTRPENLPPSAPVHIYPTDEALGIPLDLTLRWSESIDPEGEVVVYKVYLGNSERLNSTDLIADRISETFIEVENLSYNRRYFWGVSAIDENDNGSGIGTTSFTTIPDPDQYPGIYTELIIHRSRYISETTTPGYYEAINIDNLSARFDSVYAPDGYIHPLQPASVFCQHYGAGGGYSLSWIDGLEWYFYNNPVSGSFLGPGTDYVFDISAGGSVPDLMTDPVLFPECNITLVEPLPFSNVSRDGFTLTWEGNDSASDCPATVRLRVEDASMGEWTDIDKVIENTGSYTLTEVDLSLLDPMTYQIIVVLMYDNTEQILASGYDPRSFVRAEYWTTLLLYLPE